MYYGYRSLISNLLRYQLMLEYWINFGSQLRYSSKLYYNLLSMIWINCLKNGKEIAFDNSYSWRQILPWKLSEHWMFVIINREENYKNMVVPISERYDNVPLNNRTILCRNYEQWTTVSSLFDEGGGEKGKKTPKEIKEQNNWSVNQATQSNDHCNANNNRMNRKKITIIK